MSLFLLYSISEMCFTWISKAPMGLNDFLIHNLSSLSLFSLPQSIGSHSHVKDSLLGGASLRQGFSGGSAGKESACIIGDLGSIPGLGSSIGERNSYPLQYSGLENSKGVAKRHD